MTRQVGLEEELLLVDPETGSLRNASAQVRHEHRAGDADEALDGELLQHMVETQSRPHTDLDGVAADLRAARASAIAAAERAGVHVAAAGTAPLGTADSRVTPDDRYERIVREFGTTGQEAGTMGMHVHVDVADDEEGVRVLDGLRPWLPVLLAIAANSPYSHGADTGYASFRHQVWGRWPTSGPSEPFGDAVGYHRTIRALIETGAALDSGMLYFDARLAERYPTVEIRIADVCTDVEDAILVGCLARALVETAATAERAPTVRTDLLRAAQWRAARHGLAGTLVHPTTHARVPAAEAVEALTVHAADALSAAGDTERVAAGLQRLSRVGGGASRQRVAFERTGTLAGVVADLVARTRASAEEVPCAS